MLGSVSSAISILNAGKGIYDWLTGSTVSQKLDRVSDGLRRLEENLYYRPEAEVFDISRRQQIPVDDIGGITAAARPLHDATGGVLTVSQPIVTPDRMKRAFEENPEHYLFGIKPLTGGGAIPGPPNNDPTLLPVTFFKWGVHYVGYIKIGSARDLFDCGYDPRQPLGPSREPPIEIVSQLPGSSGDRGVAPGWAADAKGTFPPTARQAEEERRTQGGAKKKRVKTDRHAQEEARRQEAEYRRQQSAQGAARQPAAPTTRGERRRSIGLTLAVPVALGLSLTAFLINPPTPVPEVGVASAQASQDGRTFQIVFGNGVVMDFVRIPPGRFLMGSPEEEPNRQNDELQHEVTISKPFYMGIYEVTQEQYAAVMGIEGWRQSQFRGRPRNPVEGVNWNDAAEFCKKLSAKTGKTVRLPTEAEWEYACRAGAKTEYCNGAGLAALREVGWCSYDGRAGSAQTPRTVGSLKPNAFGLYDMHGNVYEWCSDWYHHDYRAQATTVDPQGPASGKVRVVRGGCWFFGPRICRSARRGGYDPSDRYSGDGFRVVLD
ncbi:MAG: Serine/threonine-protein kinase pkn1 [Planctomycetes bacterium ADurb.Bin126]|nr:MAG: Serine/threonine-protein kinase pkn1 [Planctomycetes bacterium ADurb.Bin126]HOD84247.1 SUMF1/EgtB/PvdO family nonheme iron enzyme [Phycisphaerae bacterium]HQL75448.1 SUMF1/EgtB/PvdO family nonheme iron enzyme [Phycisphaerae bacterium]